MYRCAGIAGVDPGPLTFAELFLMAQARVQLEWGLMSSLMAHLFSLKTGKPASPNLFNPTYKAPPPPKSMKGLRAMFPGIKTVKRRAVKESSE